MPPFQVVDKSLATFSHSLADVGDSVFAAWAVLNVVRQSRALLLCNLAWISCDGDYETSVRTELLAQAARTSSYFRRLNSEAQAAGLGFYSTPDVPVLFYA